MTAPRYLALVGCGSSAGLPGAGEIEAPIESALAALRPVPLEGDLKLWASDHVISLRKGGAIVGHLFTRSLPSRRVISLTDDQIRTIITTAGESLISEFWGGYVAFLREDEDCWRILRDPSGALPLYWRRWGTGMALAPEMGQFPFRPRDGLVADVDALTAYLCDPYHAGSRTCIAGVEEVLAGDAVVITRGQTVPATKTLWSPWDHCSADPAAVTDLDRLRATVLDAVRAWGDCFSSILVGVSGGLDSSLVCAGLTYAQAQVRGLTMVWPDRHGDERAYARSVARACRFDLEARAYRLEDVDPFLTLVPHAPRPFTAPYVHSIAASRERIARAASIDAFFSGNGGDSVFCLMKSVTPIIDRLNSRSAPGDVWRTVSDVMAMTQAGLPTIARHLLARSWPRRSPARGLMDASFLGARRGAQAIDVIGEHPWHTIPRGIRPGSAAHVRMIRRAQGNDGFHSRRTHPPSIAPLLAQPIMELCLAIPSWEWIRSGRDRAAIRFACAGDLPREILQRSSKGGPAGFVDRLFWENEAAVLAGLRTGIFADLGIVADIPERIMPGSTGLSAIPARLLSLLAAQNWAQAWGLR